MLHKKSSNHQCLMSHKLHCIIHFSVAQFSGYLHVYQFFVLCIVKLGLLLIRCIYFFFIFVLSKLECRSTNQSARVSSGHCRTYGWWVYKDASRLWLPFHWICHKVHTIAWNSWQNIVTLPDNCLLFKRGWIEQKGELATSLFHYSPLPNFCEEACVKKRSGCVCKGEGGGKGLN